MVKLDATHAQLHLDIRDKLPAVFNLVYEESLFIMKRSSSSPRFAFKSTSIKSLLTAASTSLLGLMRDANLIHGEP